MFLALEKGGGHISAEGAPASSGCKVVSSHPREGWCIGVELSAPRIRISKALCELGPLQNEVCFQDAVGWNMAVVIDQFPDIVLEAWRSGRQGGPPCFMCLSLSWSFLAFVFFGLESWLLFCFGKCLLCCFLLHIGLMSMADVAKVVVPEV